MGEKTLLWKKKILGKWEMWVQGKQVKETREVGCSWDLMEYNPADRSVCKIYTKLYWLAHGMEESMAIFSAWCLDEAPVSPLWQHLWRPDK